MTFPPMVLLWFYLWVTSGSIHSVQTASAEPGRRTATQKSVITTTNSLRHRFARFLEQQKAQPTATADLEFQKFSREIENILEKEIASEQVHLADRIYRYMGDSGLEKRISLLRRYKAIAPVLDEQFWAYWNLVDSLALLRRNREAIEEQSNLYDWAWKTLSDIFKCLFWQ